MKSNNSDRFDGEQQPPATGLRARIRRDPEVYGILIALVVGSLVVVLLYVYSSTRDRYTQEDARKDCTEIANGIQGGLFHYDECVSDLATHGGSLDSYERQEQIADDERDRAAREKCGLEVDLSRVPYSEMEACVARKLAR